MTATKVSAECLHCGSQFSAYAKEDEIKRYCSKQCMTAYERIHGRLGREKVERVAFACKQCGNTFTVMPGFLAAYRKKHSRDPIYCSRTCTGIARRLQTEAEQIFQCETCGKTMERRRYERSTGYNKFYATQKYCSPECKHAGIANAAEKRFLAGQIGRHVKRNGYVWISVPANLNGGIKTEILEHRWVMEQSLGRKLYKGETVHHINGNRADNRIENLELFSDRHGPGQRVADKVAFAVEILELYPQFITAELQERLLNIEVMFERKFHVG